MDVPQLFPYKKRASIPTDSGLYAYYLDLSYVVSSMKRTAANGLTLTEQIDKLIRSMTSANPKKNAQFNNFGISTKFTSIYELQATHIIKRGDIPPGLTQPQLRELAQVMDKCGLFLPPLYVGIAASQSLFDRYKQHLAKYRKVKNTRKLRIGKGRDSFNHAGSFPANLVRRGIHFRQTTFACIPLTPQEIVHVRFVERLFHAVGNPPLSESH